MSAPTDSPVTGTNSSLAMPKDANSAMSGTNSVSTTTEKAPVHGTGSAPIASTATDSPVPTPTLSLLNDLIGLKNPTFAVTNVLKLLLELVGHDVCLTKRSHHSLYWALSQARDMCDNINALIAEAETEDDPWSAFDRYTEMLMWLETFLLKFAPIAQQESRVSRFADKVSLQEDLKFIEEWLSDRAKLGEIFLELSKSEYLPGDATVRSNTIKAIHRRDDLALVMAINLRLQEQANIAAPANKYLSAIVKQFKIIRDMLTGAHDTQSDDVFVYSVHFAMGIDIFVNTRDHKLAPRLQDVDLWKLAQSGVLLIDQHAKDPTLPPAALKAAWKAFYDALCRDAVAIMPEAYGQLRKLISQTRRPYYAQSIQLVSGCATLAGAFKQKKTFEMVHSLELALENVKKALEAAAAIAYDPTQPAPEFKTAEVAFEDAKNSLKDCFTEYKISSDDFERKMTDSRTSDSKSVTQLQARFSSHKTAVGQTVELSVTVSGKAFPVPHTRKYTVDPDQTLHAILWMEESLKNDTALRSKAYFHNVKPGQP
ncbi:hypothetical protein GGX14DRAFT_14486, partial [Mycena pura]